MGELPATGSRPGLAGSGNSVGWELPSPALVNSRSQIFFRQSEKNVKNVKQTIKHPVKVLGVFVNVFYSLAGPPHRKKRKEALLKS